MFQCNKCKFQTDSRKKIREHVRTHGVIGGRKPEKEVIEDALIGAGLRHHRYGIADSYTKL